ncbi:unnamed protein product [Prorocentrum cordatum]|uniref:Uncharacterized protein n=1 Tax=Prorocentrum cordatum TaxID=2364126 RepID=A0ABN9SB73_9DINO|nr:unnamed protein product [Polarella glacialis]
MPCRCACHAAAHGDRKIPVARTWGLRSQRHLGGGCPARGDGAARRLRSSRGSGVCEDDRVATLIWEERAGAEREEQREEEHEQVPSSTAPAEVTPETIRAQSYAGLHWLGGQIVRKRDRSCLPAHVKLQDAAPTRWQC